MATPAAAVELNKPKPQRVLPGFGLTLGYTMVYLSLLVLIPRRACRKPRDSAYKLRGVSSPAPKS